MNTLDRLFGLSRSGSTAATELRAGLTTFVTMAYILVVNPAILSDAIRIEGVNLFGELLTATALAAATGSILMGLLARYPFALAPGMGLNAYFAYSVVLGRGVDWRVALGAVFVSGLCFLALSGLGVREAVLRGIPAPLRAAIAAGIGAFLLHLGLQAAGLVVDHPATLVTLGELSAPSALLALGGLALMGGLQARGVRGAILIGVVAVTLVAIASGAPVYRGEAFQGVPGGWVQAPAWPTHIAGAMDLRGALGLGLLDIVFVFLFVDFFDTAGTLTGLGLKVGVLDAEGHMPRARRAFASDAVATCVGAALGTSTTTSYIESAAGVEAGGRTGLTAVTVGALFLLAIPLWPFAAAVPAAATAPALMLVGASMLGGLKQVDWDDALVAIPVALTVLAMPLSYSIANGLSLGILSWSALHLLAGRRVSPLMLGVSAVLIARYAWLAGG
ncbi:MAG: NCS2 family permease [Alphaproteobacteria bacterium]|nr:NCS2 family permease [Alphaproteobacteria bacterium]MCB9792327.1 NCS2 family permease [Alphaproteobacteria bacterium]